MADYLSKAAAFIAGLLLAGMTVIISWQIFGRFVLNDTPSWTEEAAGTLIVYMTLFGAAASVWTGAHISIDLVTAKLPPRAQMVLRLVVYLLIAAFGAVMVVYGAKMMSVVQNWTNPTLQVSRSLNYAAFPASGALMALFALLHAVALLRGAGRDNDQGEKA